MGDLNYPLVSDLKREISVKYGVLSEEGVALRGLFIIDKEARLRPSLMLLCCSIKHICSDRTVLLAMTRAVSHVRSSNMCK